MQVVDLDPASERLRLRVNACRAFGLSETHATSILTAPSAGVALDAIASVVAGHCRRVSSSPGVALIVTPALDIYPPYLASKGLTPEPFVIDPQTMQLDLDRLRERLQLRPRVDLVILASPSNPLGTVTPADTLVETGNIVADVGATLIVDQVLRWADPHELGIPQAPEVLKQVVGLRWVSVFDTAKAFTEPSQQSKMGFVVVSDAMWNETSQFFNALLDAELPMRAKVFSDLLGWAADTDLRASLSKLALHNLDLAEDILRPTRLMAMWPDAGTALNIDIGNLDASADEVAQLMFKAGVGCLAGDGFFLGGEFSH